MWIDSDHMQLQVRADLLQRKHNQPIFIRSEIEEGGCRCPQKIQIRVVGLGALRAAAGSSPGLGDGSTSRRPDTR